MRWILQKLISGSIFLIVLFSFLANPAPVSIEWVDLGLIALSVFLGLLSLASTMHYEIQVTEARLLFAVFLYFSYLILSALFGLLHGVPLLNMMRSFGPYISFVPLMFIGFLPASIVNINRIAFIFILVGLIQISYLFYLYFFHAESINTMTSVLRHRITLMDPRTTLPFLLAVALLPGIFFKASRFITLACILLSLIAAMMTLTRAIVLSMLFGWFCFACLYIYYQSQLKLFSYKTFLRQSGSGLLCLLTVLLCISFIPKVHLIEMGLLARFSDRSASGSVDYSDGRIFNEWIPALWTWLHSGWLSIFFGIGAGNSFTVLTGEERTYIHNLGIYSLVYGGIFGLVSCLWFYYTLFKTLMIRAFQQHHALTYITFSALLASLFFYGQLFAVHKGLAFNVILFLLVGIALLQPGRAIKEN